MSFRFDLASFEFHASAVTPVASSNRRFIILAVTESDSCDQLLCDASGVLLVLDNDQANRLSLPVGTEQYLGKLDGDDLWIRTLRVTAGELPAPYQWQGLRSQLERLTPGAFQLAGRALQIARWFYDHRFCGRCGQPTAQDSLDFARVCQRCSLRFYPRISPCMIVLVTRGDEILLAHHHRASRVMYTTLAGFVEAGEGVEECIRREVMEEVGVRVRKLEYFHSQPWPFPGQLMLGFFAEYEAGEISIDPIEIIDAKWFRYDELPQVPATATVAGQLIAHYVGQRIAINHKQ
ncbi:NAD(+) diphosphatase [Cellvibrio mixtus]|uniref:NAD(+) diphosphatase n=1 Tax=Cellvibrio mixtus TaxID=39650 RepID=UPI000693B014|nr:NAD(+) diphosphatase [Cellvibrio mixtus]